MYSDLIIYIQQKMNFSQQILLLLSLIFFIILLNIIDNKINK